MDVLDKFNFGARLGGADVHLIHERAYKKNPPAGRLQKIFRGQRVRDFFQIKSFALVPDGNHQVAASLLEFQADFFAGIVGIAMQHGVDRSFPHRHGDSHDLVIVEARFGSNPAGCLLGAVDGLQRRIQRVGDPLFGHGKKFWVQLCGSGISAVPPSGRRRMLCHGWKR